ncbi:MAG: hypothetical protein K8R79_11340 [Calditrichales bacterium]|nr:hypothetical protein [Calditrichales bacterium]
MRFFKVLVFTLALVSLLSAQNLEDFAEEPSNTFNGGLGVTWIDGVSYTTFTISPELAFGKFGVGLNIELLFDNANDFKFRKIGWEKGAGAFRMIRYLRWGLKHDPVYIRIGSLQSTTLGHGFIMGYYSNQANYDERKIGLEFDLDFDAFGFETMTSNLGNLEIIGGRLYFRPLFSSEIPVIKNLEFGATYATDINPDNTRDTDDGIFEWGADIGLPIIQTKVFNSTIYADYAKINNYGDGKAVGIKAGLPDLIGLFGLYAKLEKRFLSDQFLPNYYNTLYELERSFDKKIQLETAPKTEGIFGELAGHIAGKIRLIGNYQHANRVKNSGIMHLEAKAMDLVPNVRLIAAYDKSGIETFEDMRTLDVRSVATAEIGYRTYQFIYVSLLYRWNYIAETDENGVTTYKPQERFEPRITFSMDF